jgi:hypothetical protein
VSEFDTLVGGALREIAGQAAVPRLNAGTLWRAGRRRRLRTAMASAAGVAAAAVLVPLAAGGPAPPGPGAAPAAASVRLASPIQLRQVAAITGRPCPAGSYRLPSGPPVLCLHVTGTGMTITRVESARISQAFGGPYALVIRLTPADRGRFAALTGKLAGLPSPRCQLAIIIGGVVVSHPVVEVPVTWGTLQITGLASRAMAVWLRRSLLAGSGGTR